MNLYTELKPKEKEDWREKSYFNMLLGIIIQMFEYKNLPEGIDPDFLEIYLTLDGRVGIFEHEGQINAVRGSNSGQPNAYGIGVDFTGGCPLYSKTGRVGVDCAVGYNNSVKVPDRDLYRAAEQFGQTDLSQVFNIQRTRINPVVVVKDNKQAEAMKVIQKQLKYGYELPTIADETVNWDESGKEIKLLEIGDPALVSKIQYLSEYFQALQQRIFTYWGIPTLGSVRHAQNVSNEQSESQEAQAWIYPLDRLKARRKMVDMINSVFGTDISVDFSTIWKQNYEAFLGAKDKNQAEVEKLEAETEKLLAEAENVNNPESEELSDEDKTDSSEDNS